MAQQKNELQAESRKDFGKGYARRIRRENKVPAVLYNGNEDPIHISLPGHETMLALRQANVLHDIFIDGKEDHMALPKQVQRHPVTGDLIHVDLIIVRRGERVSVEIPVSVVGHDKLEDTSLVVSQEINALSVSAEATNIPEGFEVSVAGFALGDQILASQFELPEGVELEEDPESVVVTISVPDEVPEEPETDEDAEGEAGAEAAKGGEEEAEEE